MERDIYRLLFYLTIPIVFWILTAAALFSGFRSSINGNDFFSLSRSGAVVIVIALFMVMVDHWSSANILSRFAKSRLSWRGNKELKETVRNLAEHHNLEKTDREIAFLADFFLEISSQMFAPDIKDALSSSLKKHELAIASIGTLAWAFGDIPFL